MKSIFSLCVFSFCVVSQARAETVREYLHKFHENPAQQMQRLPNSVDANGVSRSRGYIKDKLVEEMMSSRTEVRDQVMSSAPLSIFSGIVSAPDEKDRPERLIEPGEIVRNLSSMETAGLNLSVLEKQPWQDSYWPIYKGLVAIRYADKQFPNSGEWIENYNYYLGRSPSMVVAGGNPSEIDALSPAEKYDYVMGDMNFTLTSFAWNLGRKHYEESGRVAKWMGICHGWAGASHMQAKYPANPVLVTAPNGTSVTFYPQDIKALQSMLWANTATATRFVGDRCDVSRPDRNAYGRILNPKCFDVNPGTWHIAVVNQLGRNHRSFVMDATYDAEVWNYPLVSYRYSYFNPQSLQESQKLSAAVIPISEYRLDKFREFRSPDAKYIVGIYMDASHVKAVNPTRGHMSDTPPLNTVRFIYDLELDANMNIIGGEWYSNAHPDFIWTFDKDAQAMGVGDAGLINDDWTINQPVSARWTETAQRASARGTPLYSFLKRVTEPGMAPLAIRKLSAADLVH